jgi:hypothetical protein
MTFWRRACLWSMYNPKMRAAACSNDSRVKTHMSKISFFSTLNYRNVDCIDIASRQIPRTTQRSKSNSGGDFQRFSPQRTLSDVPERYWMVGRVATKIATLTDCSKSLNFAQTTARPPVRPSAEVAVSSRQWTSNDFPASRRQQTTPRYGTRHEQRFFLGRITLVQ